MYNNAYIITILQPSFKKKTYRHLDQLEKPSMTTNKFRAAEEMMSFKSCLKRATLKHRNMAKSHPPNPTSQQESQGCLRNFGKKYMDVYGSS